jgi:hypothetical protein
MIQYIIAAGIGAFLGSRSKKSKKSYAHGGSVKVGKKYGDWSVTQYKPLSYDDLGSQNDGYLKLVNQDTFDEIIIDNDNALKGSKWFTNSVKGIGISDKKLSVVIDKSIASFKSTYAEGGGVNDVDFQEWKKATISNRAKILGRVSEMRQAEGGVKYYKGIGYDVSEIEEALNPFSAINENNTYAKGGYVMGDYNDTLPNGITLTDIRMENEGVEITGQEFQLFDTETGETEYLDNEDDLFDKYDGERYDAKTVWYYTYDGEDLRYEERYDGYAKGGKTRKKRKK